MSHPKIHPVKLYLLICGVLFMISILSCKTRKVIKQEDIQTVEETTSSESKESSRQTEASDINLFETDNSGTWEFEEVIVKTGKDTSQIRRTTRLTKTDKMQAKTEQKNSDKETAQSNKSGTNVKEKQVKHDVMKVSTGMPWYVYLLCGVACAGAILFVVYLKFR